MQKILFEYPNPETLLIRFSGDWSIYTRLPSVEEIASQLSTHKEIKKIDFDISGMEQWDSGFVSFLLSLVKYCEHGNIQLNRGGLPEGVQKLLAFASEGSTKEIIHQTRHESFLESVGGNFLRLCGGIYSLLDFLGDVTVSFGRFFIGKSYFRRDEFFAIVQRCGADALPLVSLISMLVGMILAFIGAIQLKLFGAQIYIADIVGIGMVRVMGAVMTGVLMSGRTGASFAAELGIMQTNEEIDALKTLGISPVEFLVLPRVLALLLMMPLLTLYADLLGIFGGFVISVGFLGLNPIEYWHHTQSAVKMAHLWVGVIHGFTFGIIIAVAGCLRGIKCERSAAAVGEATTQAVVEAITSIVIATAIITFVCQVIGV